ncbi:MAG: hypothetical protein LUH36_00920 [Oscillospiraceae bacterium]|nr:hypothetical protein [Oscillospiraceae bacterium]
MEYAEAVRLRQNPLQKQGNLMGEIDIKHPVDYDKEANPNLLKERTFNEKAAKKNGFSSFAAHAGSYDRLRQQSRQV